jgi:hypothetical protein
MSGPFTLVDAISRQPALIGDTRATIRSRDALRFGAGLISVEAPTAKHPSGRVCLRYGDGTLVTVSPGHVGAAFIPIDPAAITIRSIST